MQELALARSASVHCGKKSINWADLADAVALFATRLDIIRDLFANSRQFRFDPDALGEIEALGAYALVEATNNLFRRSVKGVIQEYLKSLEALVSSLLAFDASDPRDTIYALISIANDSTISPASSAGPSSGGAAVGNTALIADYDKDILEVYRDFVAFCISRSKSLDIICRHWATPGRKTQTGARYRIKEELRDNTIKLPSWIQLVDNSTFGAPEEALNGRSNGDSLVGQPDHRPYNAANNSEPVVRFGTKVVDQSSNRVPTQRLQTATDMEVSVGSNEIAQSPTLGENPWKDSRDRSNSTARTKEVSDGTLYVKGIRLDTIARLSPRLAQGLIFRECLRMGRQPGSPIEEELEEADDILWRTLVADRGPRGTNTPRWYRRAWLHCLAKTRNGDINTSALIKDTTQPHMVREYLKRAQNVVWNRKLLESDNENLFGLAPTDAEPGDVIAVLFGCSVPVILREHRQEGGKKHFQFIGESYIHGKMMGEAMSGVKESSPAVEEFNIR